MTASAPIAATFASSSSTRFSPTSLRPAAIAASIASTGWAFVTATSRTSSADRPAAWAALAMRSRTEGSASSRRAA